MYDIVCRFLIQGSYTSSFVADAHRRKDKMDAEVFVCNFGELFVCVNPEMDEDNKKCKMGSRSPTHRHSDRMCSFISTLMKWIHEDNEIFFS